VSSVVVLYLEAVTKPAGRLMTDSTADVIVVVVVVVE